MEKMQTRFQHCDQRFLPYIERVLNRLPRKLTSELLENSAFQIVASDDFHDLCVLSRRFLSPLLGRRCRYLPTCSEYAHDAISEWGAVRGTWMAMKRVGRCNPLREGGFDPVPRRTGQATDVEVEAH